MSSNIMNELLLFFVGLILLVLVLCILAPVAVDLGDFLAKELRRRLINKVNK